MDRADSIAATERVKTAERHIHQAAKVIGAEEAVEASGQPLIQNMVNTGEITPVVGQAMVQQIEDLPPPLQSGVMQVIAECGGLGDARLIKPLADMLAREGTEKPSRTLQTLRTTKTLAGTPLPKATITDLQQAKAESQSDAITDSENARRRAAAAQGKIMPEPVVLTIYKYDPKRTLRELKKALGGSEYKRLRDAILGE
jgi:hypothetical protein